MFAISPVTTTPATLSVPPSAVAVPVSDTVSTRLTSVAVAAPLSNTSITNEAQSQTPVEADTTPSAKETIVQNAIYSGVTTLSTSSGPSTPFLAQLISQNENAQNQEDDQIALATSSSHFSPAPTYNAFLGYSIVKYRPSDAGLSSTAATTTVASDTAQNDPVTPTTITATNDYQAYNTTQSRNQSNLATTEPQFALAG